jgi:NADP-dependent 3-hydroxy acid dehydrogenase YdfG
MEGQGRVAIVTGASSGIGRAVAEELADMGYSSVLTARRADRLQNLANRLPNSIAVPGDISEPDMPEHLLRRALDHFGRCDVVMNNAGLIEVGPIGTINIERVCSMVRVNVEAAYRLAYTALKHFKNVGEGILLNTSSVMGTKVRPTAGAYAGTKYAIEALSEALRMELANENIQVVAIEPGLVLTELHDQWETHPSESMNISDPLQPADIARCVRFILEQPSRMRVARLMVLPRGHEI